MSGLMRMRALQLLPIVTLYMPVLLEAVSAHKQGYRVQSCASLQQEPINLGKAKEEIKMYRASGAWEFATECVAQQAIKELRKYARSKHKKLAVVFDLDDTLLSNWDFLLLSDFGYNRSRFKQLELLGKNDAIVPVKKVFFIALELGMAVFGITGRRESEREATERNLTNLGLTGWTHIYFKPMDYDKKSIVDFKSSCRRDIVDQGYELVANLGDQKSDLVGSPQARANFKIPNPMYIIP